MVAFDSVIDNQDTDAMQALTLRLSAELCCPALTILVHDDDVFMCFLCRDGKLIDSYNSFLAILVLAQALTKHQQAALSLLESPKLAEASTCGVRAMKRGGYMANRFSVSHALRPGGWSRPGAKIVSVFWDEYGLAGSGWDTHWNHFSG